jgi:ribosomal subunit interface protein
MQLTVKGKHLDVGDSLRQHVQDHLQDVVGKYFSSPIDAHVTFSRDAHLFHADITVHAGRGIVLQSTADAAEPYIAFDDAAAKVGKRLSRHRNRLKDHHKNEAVPAESVMAQYNVLNAEHESESEELTSNPVVVAEMTTPIEMLTVSEAVMRLDLGQLPALLFRNRSHGHLNMIYRRVDGHIGWVDPAQNIAVNQPAKQQNKVG